MRAFILLLVSSSLISWALPAHADCPEAAAQRIRDDLAEYSAKVRAIWPDLRIATAFECELGKKGELPAYNGFYDGSRRMLHFRISTNWTSAELRGPVGHEFGHALWSAFTEDAFASPRLRQIGTRYAKAESTLLPRLRSVEQRLNELYAKDPRSAELKKLTLEYQKVEEDLAKLLQIDGLAKLYFALDELVAGSITAYLNQDPRADTGGVTHSHRDFSIVRDPNGWSEKLYQNRRGEDLYALLAPARFPIGEKIFATNAESNLKQLLEAFRTHLEANSERLRERPDQVNWDGENQALIERVRKL